MYSGIKVFMTVRVTRMSKIVDFLHLRQVVEKMNFNALQREVYFHFKLELPASLKTGVFPLNFEKLHDLVFKY